MQPDKQSGQEKTTAPFDAVAQGYDLEFTETAIGKMQRAVAPPGPPGRGEALRPDIVAKLRWGICGKIRSLVFLITDPKPETLPPYWGGQGGLPKPETLPPFRGGQGGAFELNCGTGADAISLAQLGYRVLATDISPMMIEVAKNKSEKAGLSDQIQFKTLDINDINPDELGAPFELVFSNFGGLNCISPEQMRILGQKLPDLVALDGHFRAVVMGRFCCWEILYFLLKAKPRTAFRRFKKNAVPARLDAHTTVDTWYYGPYELMNLLGRAGFELTSLQAVGFWLPPSYLNPFFEKRRWLLNGLNRLEKWCRGRIWAFGADHYVLTMKRLPT
jgi:SAM-dependent methyltransferase